MADSGKDAKFFQRSKVDELRTELNADKKDKGWVRKKTVLKKIIANATMGNDMSALFPDVVQCINIQVLEIKKMVYLYLINYARSKPDQVPNAIPGFLSDCNDRNPLIRALAIRTMSYIHVPTVLAALIDPLRHSLKDADPYVRKTAAICVAKLYMHDKRLIEKHSFIGMLRDLLADANPTVVANAVAALVEISERSDNIQLKLNLTIASKLVAALAECSEWGQTYILEALMFFVPADFADAEILAERIAVRLQHANSAVVLTATKVILYLMNYIASAEFKESLCRKLSPPLVTLLSSGPEVQYVALRNILLVIQRRPLVLQNEVKVFFCKYNDPIYVKMAKLEIIYRLANERNVEQVLAELREYASEVDVDFARKAVRSIGRLAIKIESSADRCIHALLALIQTKVNYVVQEAIVVIKDIFRKYPNRYESVISTLCENLDNLDESEAKAAMIWIIGQYADRIENSDELLEDFLYTFLEEPSRCSWRCLQRRSSSSLSGRVRAASWCPRCSSGRPRRWRIRTCAIAASCTGACSRRIPRLRGRLCWVASRPFRPRRIGWIGSCSTSCCCTARVSPASSIASRRRSFVTPRRATCPTRLRSTSRRGAMRRRICIPNPSRARRCSTPLRRVKPQPPMQRHWRHRIRSDSLRKTRMQMQRQRRMGR